MSEGQDVTVTGAATRARYRALILPVAVALAAAVLGAAPAHAGGGCNLRYYVNTDGSPNWPSVPVNDPSPSGFFSCSVTPAIARWPGGTMVTGDDAWLPGFFVYKNDDGGGNFKYYVQLGGKSSVGAPAMISGSSPRLAVSIDNTLAYFLAPPDSGLQGYLQVAGQGVSVNAPAIARAGTATEIAATGTDDSLSFYWIINGTSTWHAEQIGRPGTMQGAPAMVAGNYTEEIAVTARDGSMRYYWSRDGTPTWYGAQIAPPGTVSTSPAMTRFNGGTEIAIAGL